MREREVCSNGPGHMTKMAATPISGKNPLKIVLQYQKADNLGTCSIGDVGPTKFMQMMILG